MNQILSALSDRYSAAVSGLLGCNETVDGERAVLPDCAKNVYNCRRCRAIGRQLVRMKRALCVRMYKRRCTVVNSNCPASGGPVPPLGGPWASVVRVVYVLELWVLATRTNQRIGKPTLDRSQAISACQFPPPANPAERNTVMLMGPLLFEHSACCQPSPRAVMGKGMSR